MPVSIYICIYIHLCDIHNNPGVWPQVDSNIAQMMRAFTEANLLQEQRITTLTQSLDMTRQHLSLALAKQDPSSSNNPNNNPNNNPKNNPNNNVKDTRSLFGFKRAGNGRDKQQLKTEGVTEALYTRAIKVTGGHIYVYIYVICMYVYVCVCGMFYMWIYIYVYILGRGKDQSRQGPAQSLRVLC